MITKKCDIIWSGVVAKFSMVKVTTPKIWFGGVRGVIMVHQLQSSVYNPEEIYSGALRALSILHYVSLEI